MLWDKTPGSLAEFKNALGGGAAAAIGRCMELFEKGETSSFIVATYLAAGFTSETCDDADWKEVRRTVERSKKRKAARDTVLSLVRAAHQPKFEADIAHETRAHILPYLPRPLQFTTYELDGHMATISTHGDEYVREVGDDDEYDTDGALDEFCSYLEADADEVLSGEFDLCRLKGAPSTALSEALWDGKHANVGLVTLVREDVRAISAASTAGPDIPWTLRARVDAIATAAAVEHARDEAERVTRALLRLALDLVEEDERPFYPKRLLTCNASHLLDALPLIREWLGSYYGPKPKRSSLDGRIRNAIELIVEAGHQANDAIAVPLLCAAMEALVGGDREATTKSLADYVAALLEPDGATRHMAITFVRKLYSDRSAVIHGSSMEIGTRSRAHARILCAHLLRAVIEWRRFQRGVTGQENAQTFMEEMRMITPAGKSLPTAREDALVRKLWTK